MKVWKLAALLCLTTCALGQSYYQNNAYTTTYINGTRVVSVVSGAKVRVCSTISGACTQVPVYTTSALSTQVTQPITPDGQGNFGFWIPTGSYSYRVLNAQNIEIQAYPFTVGGGTGGSGTVTNLSTGSWPTWLTPSVSNPTTTPSLAVAASSIPNSALASSTMTINSTACTLGGSCSITGGGGVSSLNSLAGALSIVGGSNVTVTPSGSSITIAATGTNGLSGQTAGYYPKATTATTAIGPGIISDDGTTATVHGDLNINTITGSTQCLHVNSLGTVSGSGADCGIGGGGSISGQTINYLPKATSSTASTISSAVEDTGSSLVYHGTGTQHGIAMPSSSGGLTAPAVGTAGFGTDSSGTWSAYENGGSWSRLCTVGNGLCGGGGGSSAFSALTSGTNTAAAMLVGAGASLAPTSTGTITANAVNLAASGNGGVTGTLPVANGGTGTTSPGIVAGTNVTVSGTWPNQTVNSSVLAPLPALVAQPTAPSSTFLQALNNAANQAVNVVVAGDSFTICDHTNCGTSGGPLISTNRWVEQLRIQLQAIYGNHGTGMVPVTYTVTGGSGINSEAWSCTGTTDFSTGTLGPGQTSGQPGNTLIHLSNGASCTFHDARNIAWDSLNTYCMTTASSGSLAVNIDSGAFTGTACGSTTGSATATLVTLAATSSTSHSVTFTSTGDSYLYAAEGTKGTTGVSIHNIGVGGALAEMFNSTAKLAFSDLITTHAFVFMDQTNDAVVPVATGTFSTNIQNIITHEKALSGSPTVLLAIPPVDIVNGVNPVAAYTAVQQGLCASNTLTCVNIQDRWGTAYVSTSGLWDLTGTAWPTGAAGVHPNDKGSLDEAQLVYARLVNPTSSLVLTTTGTSGAATYDGTTLNVPNYGATGGAYSLISTVTPTGTGTVTFSSLGSYRDLVVVVRGASSAAATFAEAFAQFNSDTGANYDLEQNVANNATAAPVSQVNATHAYVGWLPAASSPANMGGAAEATIFDYRGSTFQKAVQSASGVKTSTAGTGFYTQTDTSWWRNTAAITSVTVFLSSGNFVTGSSVSIYGRN